MNAAWAMFCAASSPVRALCSHVNAKSQSSSTRSAPAVLVYVTTGRDRARSRMSRSVPTICLKLVTEANRRLDRKTLVGAAGQHDETG